MTQDFSAAVISFASTMCFWHWTAAFYLSLIAYEKFQTVGGETRNYDLKDAICNVLIGAMGVTLQFAVVLIVPLSIYAWAFEHARIFTIDSVITGVIIAFFLHDFVHYWIHRLGHRIGLLWAFHSVHHSSNTFNHTTAFRLFPADGRLKIMAGTVAAVLGVSPEVYLFVAVLKSTYSVWSHASYITNMSWMECIFVSPNLHKVHHARQAQYVDKNFGQVLIIWDRIFGTFQPCDEEPESGLIQRVHDNNPLTVQFWGVRQLLHKVLSAKSVPNGLLHVIMPPEWDPREGSSKYKAGISA